MLSKFILASVLFTSFIFSGCTLTSQVKPETLDKINDTSGIVEPQDSGTPSTQPQETGEEAFFSQDQDNDFSTEFNGLAKDLQ